MPRQDNDHMTVGAKRGGESLGVRLARPKPLAFPKVLTALTF
jgi:hypothetical protein